MYEKYLKPNTSRYGSPTKCCYEYDNYYSCNYDCYCGECPPKYKCREFGCDCLACKNSKNNPLYLQQTNKLIYNTVGQGGSQYINHLGSVEAAQEIFQQYITLENRNNINIQQNQSSDRTIYSLGKNIVPSRGNSTKKSITRLRPGSNKPGGVGVDIKHNSYDRYLNKKKGKIILRGENNPYINDLYQRVKKQVVNNKFNKPFLVAGCTYKCYKHPKPCPPPPPCPYEPWCPPKPCCFSKECCAKK